MKELTIKSYGVKITLPSEILVLEAHSYVAEAKDHLVLTKGKDSLGLECFIILRKNGLVNPGLFIYPIQAINIQYEACSIERYYKIRSFL